MKKVQNLKWKESSADNAKELDMCDFIRMLIRSTPQEKIGKGYEEMNKIHNLFNEIKDSTVSEIFLEDASYTLLMKCMNFMPAMWGFNSELFPVIEELKNHAIRVQKGATQEE
ncbi:MAG: hypothetical protein KAR20_15380 [Candidatus Heimdallarchaeota archaeon]|nr:hypothetical protein [Candidatus Heimdallarchaeota archaeon]